MVSATGRIYWCCESFGCHFEAGPANGWRPVLGVDANSTCNMVCETEEDEGVVVQCMPALPPEKPKPTWTTEVIGCGLMLAIVVVAGWHRLRKKSNPPAPEENCGGEVRDQHGMVSVPLEGEVATSSGSAQSGRFGLKAPTPPPRRIGAFFSNLLGSPLVLLMLAGSAVASDEVPEGCKKIMCTFCMERWANPDCYTWLTWSAYGTAAFAAMVAFCWCLSILRNLLFLCQVGWATAGRLWRCVRRKPAPKPHRRPPGYGRLWENVPLIPLVTLLLLAQPTAGETVSSTATTEVCFDSGGEKWCEWTYTTTLTLLPAGQPVELLLRTDDGQTAGTISIIAKSLSVECVAEELGWGYGYSVKVPSVKRCPGAGSCGWTGCPTPALEMVPELEKDCPECAIRCLDACSHWWCKCGVGPGLAAMVKACLFYGIRAEPTPSNYTARFFTCPVWRQRLHLELEVTTADGTKAETLELHPGMTAHLGNLSLTPTALTQAPAPVLSSVFVSDGRRMAVVDAPPSHLHCHSEAEAQRRECRLDASAQPL